MQMPGPTQFSNPPPPIIPNLAMPPPSVGMPPGPPPGAGNIIQVPLGPPPSYGHQHHYGGGRGGGHRHFFQPFRPYMRPGPGPPGQASLDEFDGKRLRKSVMRKTVDYNSSIIKALECRVWQRDFRDKRALQPDVTYYPNMEPPPSYVENPINAVVTRFVKTATNKMRCPIFCMAWTPEGRRLVTGASSGEFTLWNGLTFNFETILQAHDSPVRTMVWSHNDTWMVTGDHMGYVKYWQSNMNNVKMFQAHKEAIRGLSFSPTDQKFVTCSDDGTLRIWDFARCHEERILRGHGADVKCVHWHPQKSLIISGSKDNQQPIKLWDPKTGTSLATLHAHKSTVMDIKWNENGNWLVTASRDHLLKLFDIRNLSTEVQTFRGHKKEASSVAWHPHHEGLFCSGGSDGAILFWHVGADKEVGGIEQAHDSIVWTLAWHPLGHILCSGSNDHTSKFWTRNRPGDAMRDKYNLNTLPAGLAGMDDQDVDDNGVIPGMGPEDKVEESVTTEVTPAVPATIPGLDFEGVEDRNKHYHKKVPYSKPIPRNFVAQWNETGDNEESSSDEDNGLKPVLNPIAQALRAVIENTTIPGCIPLADLQPQAIIMYGKILPVDGDQVLSSAIAAGGDTLQRMVASGQIEQFQDVMPHLDDENFSDYSNEDTMDIERVLDNLQMPAPLPSSIFAKKGGPVAQRKSRFSDPEPVRQHQKPGKMPMGDQDMRGEIGYNPSLPLSMTYHEFSNKDPKAQEDEDLRILRDIDLREELMNNPGNFPNMMAPNMMPPGGPGGPGGPNFGPPGPGPGPGPWQQQTPWADGLRPGLNNFGKRNFVSSGNFDDAPFGNGPNDGGGGGGGNFPGRPGSFSQGGPGVGPMNPNDSRGGNSFGGNPNDGGGGGGGGNQFQGSWDGPMGGPRNQMGPRQMGPNMPMGHGGPMGPSRPTMLGNMGPGGPNMGPGGPNMGPGGPNMGPGGPNMGPGGPNMGPGGPNMGPGGPNMGPGGPNMGPGGPNMGPGGPNMGPRHPMMSGGPQMGMRHQMGPGGLNMGPGGPNMGPGGPNMGPGGPNMGPGGPNMGPGGPNMGPGGPNMGPGGPNMGPGGPNMGPGGPNMGPGGPNMGPGGPNMGGMGPGMPMGPGFQNQNSFYRGGGGGGGGGRGFSRGRGNFDKNRGGFDNGMGGFNSNRGGFDGNRGGFDGNRGGFDGNRGGFEGNRGGFDGNRGGFDGGRSGFEGKRDGFEGNRGGFNNGNRNFDKDQGGFDANRGGFDSSRGDFESNRGQDRGGNDGREGSGSGRPSRFPGSSRGSSSKPRGYAAGRDKDK